MGHGELAFSPVTPVRWIPSCALPLCISVPLFLPKRSFIRLLPRPTEFFDFGITIFAVYWISLLSVSFSSYEMVVPERVLGGSKLWLDPPLVITIDNDLGRSVAMQRP
jgi:hypothetical protein